MSAFIARQPNGLLCRFSSVVDGPTHWNMTEEDYIEMCAERARKEAREILKNYIQLFVQGVEETRPTNMTVEEIVKAFREMGYEPTAGNVERWKSWGEE